MLHRFCENKDNIKMLGEAIESPLNIQSANTITSNVEQTGSDRAQHSVATLLCYL